MHQIWTLWSLIVIFDFVTNKDFEIYQLSELTEHETFTLVS